MVTERLSLPVATSGTLPRQVEFERWGSDSMQPPQPAVSLLRVIQAMGAVAIFASTCTLAKDPWIINARMEVATTLPLHSFQRLRLTAKEARTLALSILQAAEESRTHFAEEEAARGISWEEQS